MGVVSQFRDALRRARGFSAERGQGRTLRSRTLTTVVCVVIGVMIAASALHARGTDLRPGRNTNLVDLVQTQSRDNAELTQRVSELRAEVDLLTGDQIAGPDGDQVNAAADRAGLHPVHGPAVSVTLTDAPATVKPPGVDEDLLVVHQQDIQAVANVLWAAGAEAMTIQGQRVVTTTGIKCVGNTVVLHGRPYAPPYVITAVGDPNRLEQGLNGSDFLRIYRQYVDVYHLGYAQRTDPEVTLPGYPGSIELQYARPRG